MIEIVATKLFKRDLKKLVEKHHDLNALKSVITLIAANDIDTLKQKYNWHPLRGDKSGIYDIHVVSTQDWILLYTVTGPNNITVIATGGHDILNRPASKLLP